MAARDELVAAIAGRYAQGDRAERGRILDEFAAVTGFHRKHAMRLLRAGQVTRRCGPRPDRRVYDEAVREALIVVWEASDRICGKRLRPLLPILVEAMEQHGHLQLVPEVRTRLLTISGRRSIGHCVISGSGREQQRAAGRPLRRRSGAAWRCARLTAGTIHRPGLSRQIWSLIAGRSREAALCRPWC